MTEIVKPDLLEIEVDGVILNQPAIQVNSDPKEGILFPQGRTPLVRMPEGIAIPIVRIEDMRGPFEYCISYPLNKMPPIREVLREGISKKFREDPSLRNNNGLVILNSRRWRHDQQENEFVVYALAKLVPTDKIYLAQEKNPNNHLY
jgi:hypothetical protein